MIRNYAGILGYKHQIVSVGGGSFVSATGGTITTDGNYKIHTFTALNTQTFTITSGGDVSILMIAGGGGGAYCAPSNQRGGAGGGAGGCFVCTSTLIATTYNIQVGSGSNGGASYGLSGVDGSTSTGFGMTATGGGGGGGYTVVGRNGGSGGGGGSSSAKAGGTGISGQGYAGGQGAADGYQMGGGGGGGANSVGTNGAGGAVIAAGGTGLTIWGKTYAIGGPGSYGHHYTLPDPSNGYGHGGAGGGSMITEAGAKGSSGTVIIRYQYQ